MESAAVIAVYWARMTRNPSEFHRFEPDVDTSELDSCASSFKNSQELARMGGCESVGPRVQVPPALVMRLFRPNLGLFGQLGKAAHPGAATGRVAGWPPRGWRGS
jgi:hypothetical protein